MQLGFRRADGEYRWLGHRGSASTRMARCSNRRLSATSPTSSGRRNSAGSGSAEGRVSGDPGPRVEGPLAPIRNALQIIRVSTDQESVGKVHDMLERQVDQMVRLVDDLLEVSRITRGKIELRRERVDLGAVIRSALETSKPLIDAARHELTVGLPTEPLWLDADPVRLAQVFSNLLNNAAKYTEPGGRIWINTNRYNDQVVVSVCDTGIGISPEKIPRVFNLFAQLDTTTAKAQGGLGIGLALAQRLVEMHGGRIDARSGGAGEGSEFLVHLPLAREQERKRTSNPPRPAKADEALSVHRVMVVDDNRDAADSLGMLLRLRGIQVQVANDGPAALKRFCTFHPTVILLDLGISSHQIDDAARGFSFREGAPLSHSPAGGMPSSANAVGRVDSLITW